VLRLGKDIAILVWAYISCGRHPIKEIYTSLCCMKRVINDLADTGKTKYYFFDKKASGCYRWDLIPDKRYREPYRRGVRYKISRYLFDKVHEELRLKFNR